MALTPRSGSSTSPSITPGSPGSNASYPSDDVAHMPYVADGATNKFAIDSSQYASVTRQLIGFAKGKRVLVTYYRLLNREGVNNRTNTADLPNSRNITNTEYQKIIDLEITLNKAFDVTSSAEQTNVKITGQAMMYPNMNPNIGDIFLMGVGDGRVGMCRVTSVDTLNWRLDRTYTITFLVQEFLEHNISQPLEASVSIVSYFDKQNYLGSTAALISEVSYKQLAKIRQQRVILSKLFHQIFFDHDRSSYFKPDGGYDPWVVMFMNSKLKMEDVYQRPKSLIGSDRDNYQRTIWGRLEDSQNNTLVALYPKYQLLGYNQTTMGSFVTELTRSNIVYPQRYDEGLHDYLYTNNFYNGNKEAMTPEELLVYEAITLQTSGTLDSLIINYLDPIFNADPIVQFYKIPLYIHLIDMSLRSQYREIDAPAMNYASNQDAQ